MSLEARHCCSPMERGRARARDYESPANRALELRQSQALFQC